MSLLLYHDWDSVCSFKVRMCLAEKGIAWESRRIDLIRFDNLRPAYLALNPNGVVPTIEHGGFVVIESSVINEYLDEVFGGPRLTPESPRDKATMRQWVKYQDDVLYHAQRPATFQLMVKRMLAALSKDAIEQMVHDHPQPQRARHFIDWATGPVDQQVIAEAREKLDGVLQRLEGRLAKTRWLAGATYSLAECAYAPFVDRLQRLGFADLWQDKPGVAAWAARIVERPAFTAAKPPPEFDMARARS